MDQLAISFEPYPHPDQGDLREQTREWMQENPGVMALFERFALEMASKRKHFGMRLIAERVRWEVAFTYNTEFKINDHFTPYIARELVRRHPFLRDHLEFRKTKYEKESA